MPSYSISRDSWQASASKAPKFLASSVDPNEPIPIGIRYVDWLAWSGQRCAAGEQWKPFTSRQRVVTHRPGLLWDAQVSMLPGLVVRVVDNYIAGKGLLPAGILGLSCQLWPRSVAAA
jgi:hypothetical protein